MPKALIKLCKTRAISFLSHLGLISAQMCVELNHALPWRGARLPQFVIMEGKPSSRILYLRKLEELF